MTTEPTSPETSVAKSPGAAKAAASSGNRTVVLWCLGALAVMSGVTAASPTLYQMFCQATGYGGTTQRATSAPTEIVDRMINVRFDANISPQLHWKFEPVQPTVDVKLGEHTLAFFRATNLSDKPLTGTAAFNVAPEAMGLYFSKIECFCFTEQTLQPGQSVEMPVTFFVDPKMLEDRDTRHLTNITLSYVFYPVKETAVTATVAAPQVE
ncbi:MAG: cytochrome c oxidase assembly protein [Hyphomicrobium sp.]|nr:cytochrome c oxidase assembly protein [Hyphomicrobium sp.]